MEILNTKGGNKRNASSSVEEAVAEDGTPDETITTKREKKAKKDNLEEDDHNDTSLSDDNPPFANRMEKRKKRKALDKERHHNDGSQFVEIPRARNSSKGHVASQSPLSSAGLPDIHVAVFSDLSSADSLVREAAAEMLVKELQEVQKAHEKLREKGVDEGGLQLEAEKDDGLNNCASSLRYAVRRLIRGVSSSRECARQGFALGLTLVVGTIPAVNVESVMKLITDILEVTSSMKGQEARDCLLGRLFAYGALARSGRIVQECISDNYTSCVKEFVGHVVSLASKKLYLREPAVWVILDLVEKLPVDALVGHVLEAPGMQEWFESAADVGNPDALLLALKMREKISTDNKTLSKLLPCPFSPNKLFTVDHLSSLISCFKESTFCQPRVHTVWSVLVNILMPDLARQDEDVCLSSNLNKKHKKSRKCNSSKEDNEKNLRFFFDVVIEGCLLSSSHDRKHLAFDVLILLLPRLPASCVHVILSEKLVHCLMDILSTSDSWLYKVAQYFLRELSNWIGNDDDRRVAVIIALQKHSCGRFDCITRTHTVKGLVAELNTGSGCMLFIQNLMSMFLDGGQVADEPSDQSQTTDENSEHGSLEDKDSVGTLGNLDFLKNWVIESLPRVLKNLRTDVEARFRVQKEIIKFLAVQGLFSASLGTEVTSFELQEKFKWPKAATSSTICRMCIEQLQLLLADAQKGEASWSSFHPHEMNDLGLYFMRFLGTLCNIPSVSIFRPLSNEDEKAFKSLQDMEARLSREERNHGPGITSNKVRALRYLLIQLLLQVLLRPGEFSEAASELVLCCKKAFPFLIDPEEEEFENNEMPELIDVLVDTLLSLLPQSSSPTCFSVEQVFRFFCDDITDTGLLRMLRVIKKDLKPARHQVTQSDDDDEDFLGIEEAEEEIEEADAADTGDSDGHVDGSEGLPEIESGLHPRQTRLRNPPTTTGSCYHPKTSSTVSALDESASFDPSLDRISMPELVSATRNFSPDGIIGDGSFGFVYKAVLRGGATVAVKKLSPEAFQGLREFSAEMETLGRIRHPNLVRMLAFCAAGEERVLIYEFVQHGSLDQWLYPDTTASSSSSSNNYMKSQPLDWPRRKKIMTGVASGLCYLHEGCEPRIIHRDIKASNVLLDEDFGAHIADFGLARRMDGSHSHVSTQVAGTMGYMPPEYRDGLTVATVKADVYSFGILMFEVATGKRPNWPVKMDGGKEVGLIVWARRMVEEERHVDMIDPSVLAWCQKEEEMVGLDEVREFLKIAHVCTSESPKERPTMGEVVMMMSHLEHGHDVNTSSQPSICAV